MTGQCAGHGLDFAPVAATNGAETTKTAAQSVTAAIPDSLAKTLVTTSYNGGDLVITGTPSGVGLGMKPPQHLQRGDVMTLSAGPLGSQTQQVR